MELTVFKARSLMQKKKAILIAELPDKLCVEFEDGVVVETTKRKVIYSRFFWKLHSFYPNTPLLSTHFVEHVLKGKPLTSSTHTELLTIISRAVIETYGLWTPEQKEHVLTLVYEITNDVYNEVSQYAEPYVMSIDILDFIQVVEHPPIKEAINSVDETQESIYRAYNTVNKIIANDKALGHNSLVKAIKSKMVNANQVAQCTVMRGYTTEVDGSIMPKPVMTNFTRGMHHLYDYLAESRSAAKSLYFAEAPLQDAEYFARRLQLLTMTVESISYTDCGSTKYVDWRVEPPTLNEKNEVIYPGDLKFMVGKYYLDEETNSLKIISESDVHLFGRVLKLRSPLTCQHHDPHQICAVCFGQLSNNISRFANIGHLASATLTKQSSQSVLSTKHLDSSSMSIPIMLTALLSKYFRLNNQRNAYFLNEELKNQNLKIVVAREEAIGLIDVNNVIDVANINPLRISAINYIDICLKDKSGIEHIMPVMISQGNRSAIFTTDFLKYLKLYGWENDSRNNFKFDFTNWDFNKPVFKLPEREYSFSDHSRQVAAMIESNMKKLSDRQKPESAIYTLQELFRLVNTKLNVNIAALEVIVYANMVNKKGEYGLARGSDEAVLDVADQVIRDRSLSTAYAYEEVAGTVTGPKSFFKSNRPDSVFDVFIAPDEVLKQYPMT